MSRSSIVAFCHCTRCVRELPDGQSPSSYARIEVGLTADKKLQLWCRRHQMEIGTFEVKLDERITSAACALCDGPFPCEEHR
jgi:hypothetical protein